jgi:hypothetical protein
VKKRHCRELHRRKLNDCICDANEKHTFLLNKSIKKRGHYKPFRGIYLRNRYRKRCRLNAFIREMEMPQKMSRDGWRELLKKERISSPILEQQGKYKKL